MHTKRERQCRFIHSTGTRQGLVYSDGVGGGKYQQREEGSGWCLRVELSRCRLCLKRQQQQGFSVGDVTRWYLCCYLIRILGVNDNDDGSRARATYNIHTDNNTSTALNNENDDGSRARATHDIHNDINTSTALNNENDDGSRARAAYDIHNDINTSTALNNENDDGSRARTSTTTMCHQGLRE